MQTALLAQKTSDSLNVLAARGNEVEKGLEAIQYALLGMQVCVFTIELNEINVWILMCFFFVNELYYLKAFLSTHNILQ